MGEREFPKINLCHQNAPGRGQSTHSKQSIKKGNFVQRGLLSLVSGNEAILTRYSHFVCPLSCACTVAETFGPLLLGFGFLAAIFYLIIIRTCATVMVWFTLLLSVFGELALLIYYIAFSGKFTLIIGAQTRTAPRPVVSQNNGVILCTLDIWRSCVIKNFWRRFWAPFEVHINVLQREKYTIAGKPDEKFLKRH